MPMIFVNNRIRRADGYMAGRQIIDLIRDVEDIPKYYHLEQVFPSMYRPFYRIDDQEIVSIKEGMSFVVVP